MGRVQAVKAQLDKELEAGRLTTDEHKLISLKMGLNQPPMSFNGIQKKFYPDVSAKTLTRSFQKTIEGLKNVPKLRQLWEDSESALQSPLSTTDPAQHNARRVMPKGSGSSDDHTARPKE